MHQVLRGFHSLRFHLVNCVLIPWLIVSDDTRDIVYRPNVNDTSYVCACGTYCSTEFTNGNWARGLVLVVVRLSIGLNLSELVAG